MEERTWLTEIEELKKKMLTLPEKILPYTFYRYLISLWKRIKRKGKERSYQEEYFLKYCPFSKKRYYIVRLEYGTYGIFAAATKYIFAAERVRHKGMQPVIALQWMSDLGNGNLCGENMWELVFRQRGMQDILNRNAAILVSDVNACEILNMPDAGIAINEDPLDVSIHAKEENWREYYRRANKYVKKYWKFNRYILRETNKNSGELFCDGENVMGVALRENFSEEFYAQLKSMDARKIYRQHPLGPNISEILEIVEKCVIEWKCNKIFVASVYSDSITKFEERFPGKVVCFERERMTVAEAIEEKNSSRKMIASSLEGNQNYKNKVYNVAKEYAVETMLLSKCTYLIGAKSGQTSAALALNGGQYRDIKILEDKNHISRY